jgi:hypothetical protein
MERIGYSDNGITSRTPPHSTAVEISFVLNRKGAESYPSKAEPYSSLKSLI